MVLANSGVAGALTSNKQKNIILERLVTEYDRRHYLCRWLPVKVEQKRGSTSRASPLFSF